MGENKCIKCQRLTLRKCLECGYVCDSHSLDCQKTGHGMKSDLKNASQTNIEMLIELLTELSKKIENDRKKVKIEGVKLIKYAQEVVFEAELSLDALLRRFKTHLDYLTEFRNNKRTGEFILDDLYLNMIKDHAVYSSYLKDLYKFEFYEEIYTYKIFEITSLWDEKFRNIEQRELKKAQGLLPGFKGPIERIRSFLDELRVEEGPFQNTLIESLYLNSHGKIHEYLSIEEFFKDIDQNDSSEKKLKHTSQELLEKFLKNDDEEQKSEETVFESFLKLNSEITQINMKNYQNISIYGSYILRSLKVLPNLKHLNLENNNLSENFEGLIEAMGNLVNLEIINLGWCNINPEQAITLSEIIPNFRNLTHLYLSHNDIRDNVSYIIQNIAKPQKIVYLDFSYNNITEGMLDIADALVKMSHLEYLHLGGNCIRVGVQEFADALLNCKSLFQAQLADIYFSDEIFAYIADEIPNLKYLKVLRLANLGEEHERRFKRSHTDCLIYRQKVNPNDNTYEILLVR